MEPLISVIVPIYNVEPYLRQCVDSILNQTYTNLEAILVDDGSPDNCGTICDEYAVKDSRVKVIHKENGGLSDARNAGLDAMTGEYVAFVDSDDWMEKNALEVLLRAALELQADLVIGGHDRMEDGTGQVLQGSRKLQTPHIMDKETAMAQFFLQGCAAWARLYKANVHRGIHFPVGEINEDEAIVLSLLDRCESVVEIGSVVYHYRCRPESITTTSFSAKKLIWPRHCRENLKFVQEKYPELIPDAAARYRSSLLWGLREMALSDGFDEEIAEFLGELRRQRRRLGRAPYTYWQEKVGMLLLLSLPFPVYRYLLRKRRGIS